ncbi:nuclease subunit B homolog [Candidatus Vecturithrix granuli]|uniref:Nuclease subunit B homolog n=1 Tax=Vecturithrix granuli TaxID=1499967 RepID=A0A081C454_VECG1|nr:nuclease subunit B homolog [Candidatus Vecturithrix granuli]
MPTVTVLYGTAYDGKNRELFTKCLEKIRCHEGDACLYLVRTDVRVRQLRDFTLQHLPGWFHFPIYTFPDFIKILYQRSSHSQRILTELEQKILLERLLIYREEQLGDQFYFRQFHEHPGIVGKLQDFLNGIRRVGLASPQDLETALKRITTQERGFFTELIELLTRYCAELAQNALSDESGIFLEMARRAVAGELNLHPLIRSPELLVLEGYYELTMPEQQILTALCAQFEQTFLTLDLPMNPYNMPEDPALPRAFHLMREFVQFLKQSGFSVREYAAPLEQSSEQVYIERSARFVHFFSLPPEKISVPSQHISVQSYQTRKHEVLEIAREIKRLRQSGEVCEFREIGVAFPLIETYMQLIREIFPLFDISFTMFQGYSLASAPLVVTVFNLFNIVLEDYSRAAIARFFASPLVAFKPIHANATSGADLPALALHAETYPQLDSLALQLGILNEKAEWEQKLRAYQTTLEASGANQPLPPVCSLLPATFDFLEFLAQFEQNDPAGPDRWFTLLEQSINRFQMLSAFLKEEQQAIRERDSAALRAFLKLLQTLRQQYASSSLHWTFRKFVETLRLAVQGESYYLPEILEDSVFVMGRLDTRQVEFRYLFFGGLVEKDFPGQGEPNIFLSDQETEVLGLATYKKAFEEAAYLFYLNVMNPAEHLYLSYPLQENDKDLLRSMYIEQIEKTLAVQSQAVIEENPLQQLQRLYTSSEVLQWIGAQLFQQHGHLNEFSGDQSPVSKRKNAEASSGIQQRASACFSVETGHLWLGERGVSTQYLPLSDQIQGDASMVSNITHALRFLRQTQGEDYVQHFLSGLRAQALRISDDLTEFDGMLRSDYMKQQLRFWYKRYVYAVSEFDLYFHCPMKYFFQRLLCLIPPPQIVRELFASDVGLLLHRIVARFYAGMANESAGKADLAFLQRKADKTKWIDEAQARMAEIAREELAAYEFSGTFWESFTHVLLAGLSSDSNQQGILAKFIQLEAQDPDKATPCYLEAHFGMSAVANPTQNAVEASEFCGYTLSDAPFSLKAQNRDGHEHTIRVRGKIDRIDVAFPSSANQAGQANVVIYDYKTGSLPSGQKLKEGRFLQLPIYILAAQELLGEAYNVIAGGYYQLQSPQEIGKKHLLGSKEYADQQYFKEMRTVFSTTEEYLAWLTLSARRAICIDQDLRQGYFHPTTFGETEAGCRYCDYQQICRVDHQRMSKFQASEPDMTYENLDTIP